MKKLMLGLLAAFLMSAGLVAATSSAPSQAACGNPQYPACFSTTSDIKVSPAAAGPKKRTLTVLVKGVGTNATPVGRVAFTFKRNGNVISTTTRDAAKKVTLARTFVKKGRYSVSAKYVAKPGSIFRSSSAGSVFFRVR